MSTLARARMFRTWGLCGSRGVGGRAEDVPDPSSYPAEEGLWLARFYQRRLAVGLPAILVEH